MTNSLLGLILLICGGAIILLTNKVTGAKGLKNKKMEARPWLLPHEQENKGFIERDFTRDTSNVPTSDNELKEKDISENNETTYVHDKVKDPTPGKHF